MSLLGIILLILIIAFCLGGLPSLGLWNHGMGYGPSGLGGVLLVILIVLLLAGKI